jgi:hypothetical protein
VRPALITGKEALRERLTTPAQVPATMPEAEMPPYMESFLAHLRLLVGVPFDYLIPDERLLPTESIRFFYLDRSWTDRLVDGAIAVGKIGTREQAHHHAMHPAVRQQLDITERGVRDLQRGRGGPFLSVKQALSQKSAGVITGFLLRSSAVSGWPQMDVRAYDRDDMAREFDPAAKDSTDHELPKLRLERLSPSVLIALFEGVPKMVMCEEPHHGVQFGVHEKDGVFSVFRRSDWGEAMVDGLGKAKIDQVPVRKANHRVVAIADLWRQLKSDVPANPGMPQQNGSASFAIELLNLPWRQRFQGQGGKPQMTGVGAFVPYLTVAPQISDADFQVLIKGLVK